MGTIFPKAIDLLKSFAQKTVRGLHALGATLGITYNTEAAVGADLDAFTKANAESQTAKEVLSAALKEQKAASKAAADFIRVLRELLKSTLGTQYSVAWDAVGFFNNTLTVPSLVDKRLGLVKSMELYLGAHPELEVPGVATEAMAAALFETLAAAINSVAVARVNQREKTKARDAAAAALDQRLRRLRQELKEVLSDDDSRWLEFGFNIPAESVTPKAVEHLAVVAGAIGSAVVSWTRPVGATRFRVFRQIVGVDADFVHVATVSELSAVVGELPSGAQVKFQVTAANDAGESLPSQTVEVVVA